MLESLDDAKEELKRLDHLIYVSLKYTRTTDVIQSIVQRIINAFDRGIQSALLHLKEQKIIDQIPASAAERVSVIKTKIPNDTILTYLDMYLLYRKINKTDFTKSQEYRRHVAMTTIIEGKEIKTNIDTITEDYKKTKEFIDLVGKIIRGENLDEAS